MTILPLITVPNLILKQKSEVVNELNNDIRNLINDLIDTMYAKDGIGLAAVQAGILKKIIVIDTEWDEKNRNPLVMINAEIIKISESKTSYKEGCLSVPMNYADVIRAQTVQVKYKDLLWDDKILEADGLLGTCIQHEVDHTEGILFIDHLPKIKRDIILEKIRKNKKK